jgi:hypothetical protein
MMYASCATSIRALQIAESLKRFGVADNSQHLLVARFDASADEVRSHGWCSSMKATAACACSSVYACRTWCNKQLLQCEDVCVHVE